MSNVAQEGDFGKATLDQFARYTSMADAWGGLCASTGDFVFIQTHLVYDFRSNSCAGPLTPALDQVAAAARQ